MKRSQLSKPLSKNWRTPRLAETSAGLTFIRRFQNILAKEKFLPRGSKIIVAVSGGPDSITLLTLLARLREKHAFTLHAVHVNYELRGRDSKFDEALVQTTCDTYDIPISVFHPKVKPQKNVEETLRNIRYRLFEEVRQKYKFNAIVTGHTMNDLAETFLLNLLRGSGVTGLSPFQRQHSRIVRPLLHFKRKDIEAFLKQENIPARIDQSNFSKQFTRNRIRHELIPLMETFNPSIVETLAETTKRLGKKPNLQSKREG